VAQPIITFTTDFGPNDHFVGTMKGVVLSLNPTAQMVDICNSVYSFDVLDGALTIGSSYKYFPAGTVHVVVVDPGVGSQRRPLLVTTHTYHFIAPDNGVLSMIYDQEERVIVRHITAEHYFLHPVSHTFHGRDVFAPVAGYVSRGVEPHKIGEEITDFVRFKLPKAQKTPEGALKGVILKAGNFCGWTPVQVIGWERNREQASRFLCRGKARRSVRNCGKHGIPGNRSESRGGGASSRGESRIRSTN
jgi:S-adenosylmethionine hydrolase